MRQYFNSAITQTIILYSLIILFSFPLKDDGKLLLGAKSAMTPFFSNIQNKRKLVHKTYETM